MAAATAAAGLMCAAATKAPQDPFAMPKVTNAKVPGGVSMDPYVGAVSVDAGTGAILSADNPDRPGYPASTTKLMTLLLVLEDLQAKRYALDSRAVASKRAARQVASHIPLKEGQSMSVDDLLMALMVKSANDAAIVLAENSAGSVEAFVERMNERAAQLGMSRTRFCTPNGLSPTKADPHGFDVSTAHDLARLSVAHFQNLDSAICGSHLLSVHAIAVGDGGLLDFSCRLDAINLRKVGQPWDDGQ